MAGTVLGALLFSEEQQFAECGTSRKKQKVASNPAAAQKKAGPALSPIESAMEGGEKIYDAIPHSAHL